MNRVLVVDDDLELRSLVASALKESNLVVDQAVDGNDAVERVKANRYDLVLMDVNMPGISGLEALKEIKAHDPSIIVIMLTAFSNVKDAIESTKEGAYNYLEKPIQMDRLVYLVDRAIKAHRMVQDLTIASPEIQLPGNTEFVGQSAEMKRVFSVILKLARVDTAVLIRGESGTGKELVAQALHHNSLRKDNRFVTVNCSAIPENLIESEFFGHEKGAFTGADSRKIGKFQYAEGGTLFLDEIGDISAAMQVKLLRALQEKRFTPVGSNREIEVNVRIVAATNRNLEEMIKKGEFREDLFYRLNVLPIQLPPLRERKNDIDHLSKYFMDKFNSIHKKNMLGFSAQSLEIFKIHDWPGNIRELENVIEHAFVIEASPIISVESLPESLVKKHGSPGLRVSEVLTARTQEDLAPASGDIGFRLDIEKLDFQANKEEFEKRFLMSALKAFNGRINQTALHANIPKKTLLRKLEKYGLNAKDFIE